MGLFHVFRAKGREFHTSFVFILIVIPRFVDWILITFLERFQIVIGHSAPCAGCALGILSYVTVFKSVLISLTSIRSIPLELFYRSVVLMWVRDERIRGTEHSEAIIGIK